MWWRWTTPQRKFASVEKVSEVICAVFNGLLKFLALPQRKILLAANHHISSKLKSGLSFFCTSTIFALLFSRHSVVDLFAIMLRGSLSGTWCHIISRHSLIRCTLHSWVHDWKLSHWGSKVTPNHHISANLLHSWLLVLFFWKDVFVLLQTSRCGQLNWVFSCMFLGKHTAFGSHVGQISFFCYLFISSDVRHSTWTAAVFFYIKQSAVGLQFAGCSKPSAPTCCWFSLQWNHSFKIVWGYF